MASTCITGSTADRWPSPSFPASIAVVRATVSRETSMTRSIRRVLPLGLLLATLGCSGGLNCGSGCSDAYAFPQSTAAVPNGAQFVDNGVRMRLTQAGLDFLRENLEAILLSQFPARPGSPGTIQITLPPTTLLAGNPGVTLGQGPEETYPTNILIDVAAFSQRMTLQLDDAQDAIRLGVTNLPVGIDARVFGEANVVGFTPNAACQIIGTDCPANDPNCGIVTRLSLTMLIKARVGRGAECDEAGGVGECLKIDVDLENFDLGDIGAGSLRIEVPPNAGNLGFSFFDQQGCNLAGAPPNCSPTCSDRGGGDPFGANDECEILCAAVDFLSDILLTIGGALENVLQPIIGPIMERAIVNALEDVDGAPLAASGRLDVAGFAPGILPEGALDLGFAIAPTGSAFDVNRPAGGALGIDVILKSGFEAAPPLDTSDGSAVPHPCIRPIEGLEFGALYGGRTEFFVPQNIVTPLTGTFNDEVYHLGASVAKATINQTMFALYNTGALCLEISSDAISGLTGGGFQLSAATLDLLTQGKLKQFADANAPAIVTLNPAQPPVVRYGAGTVDEGHIIVSWPNVEVGFYVLMFERFSRVFAVSADISLEVAVFNEPGTETLRIAVVDGPNVGNFRENFNELLPGVSFSEVLESLIGVAFDAALGDGLEFNYDVGSTLSDLLGIPVFIDFQGIETAPANQREVLNVYLAMTSTRPQPRVAGSAGLRLADDRGLLRVPDAEDYGTTTRAVIPTGELHLDVDDGEGREFFARVDFGAWRGPLVARDGVLVVRDAKLRLTGEHVVTIRSRFADDPNSLEPADEAPSFTVHVDGLPPQVRLERRGDFIVARGSDDATLEGDLEYAWQLDDGAMGDFAVLDRLALGDIDARRVRVVARDRAGNVSKPAAIDVAIERRRRVEERQRLDRVAAFGCASTSDGGAVALVLLGALLIPGWRRRRQGR
jgi:MYXO-CTERM domain-containing protein